jgi:hypothetical protein
MNDDKLHGACPRRFELIRLAAGDGEEQELATLRAHANSCPACGAILTSLEMQNKDFLERRPFSKIAPALFQGGHKLASRRRFVLRLVPATAAAVVLLALGVIWFALRPEPTIRTKGDIALAFYVQKGAEAVPGRSGGTYHENDRIQFAYSSGPHRYVFLVSLDDRGNVSNFNHRSATASVPIEPGSGRVLEGSIILDASVGPERVFAIFSNSPLQLEEVKDAAKRAYHDLQKSGKSVRDLTRLPLHHSQASVLLFKK